MASLVELLQAVIDRDFGGVKGSPHSRVQVLFIHVGSGDVVSQVMRAHPRINVMLVATEPRTFQSLGVAAASKADATRATALAPYAARVVEIRGTVKTAVSRFSNPPDVVVFCEPANDDELSVVRSAYPRARVVCPSVNGFDLIA